ncbi:MAG: carbon monoxide dehydrogenase subunit [Solirubrobacterales bacterium]|jgi:carbon monoxide dehydrogenase subunit G|nr:carbon monoxide dehydrogenase subunit [Solirubrobacterales bacterium]
MKISTTAHVSAPPGLVFEFVSDIDRVAPCLPGTQLTGRDGDDHLASMVVKVGPIVGRYEGRVRFVEVDVTGQRVVLAAHAAEASGQGSAEASIVTTVEAAGTGSALRVETDLQVRGRIARFGRGALEKIAERMFAEFASNVERALAEPASDAADRRIPAAGPAGAPDPWPAPDRAVAGSAGAPVAAAQPPQLLPFPSPALRRTLPVVGAAAGGLAFGFLLGVLRTLREART